VWVKGFQCGSALAMRTRDPPIIQVVIPTQVLVEPGDYLSSFDLENQFNHVSLAQELKKSHCPLRSSTSSPSHPWRGGFAPAVGVVPRLLQPLQAHLYSQGIKLSWYVNEDSGRFGEGDGGATGPGARGYSK
jgi:hypothetical protein